MPTNDKVQTFTIIAGTMACDARCPDCVSQMTTTPKQKELLEIKDIDKGKLKKAADMAVAAGARTVLFSGKGEPTLFAAQIYEYLDFFNANPNYDQLAIKEVQTNGMRIKKLQEEGWLERWYDKGLEVISLSVVDIEDAVNEEFYIRGDGNNVDDPRKYPALEDTIETLHNEGYTVRLSVTMMKDKVDSPEDIDRVVDYCLKNGVEQLSVRPVRKPTESYCPKTSQWVADNELTTDQETNIAAYLRENGRLLEKLMHGAEVYDLRGQNICITDCLTIEPEGGYRQLIFYSSGMLMYDWTSPAAIVMGPGREARRLLKEREE